jgi:hypothetical protein
MRTFTRRVYRGFKAGDTDLCSRPIQVLVVAGNLVFFVGAGPAGEPIVAREAIDGIFAVQHPGEESENTDNPTSTWPDGDIPRPAVVAITSDFA